MFCMRADAARALEKVPVATSDAFESLRFPVQIVIRPDANFRGLPPYSERGFVLVMMFWRCRRDRERECSIVSYDGDLPEAVRSVSV